MAYVAIRDESFISQNECDFLRSLCIENGPIFRIDGRTANQLRPFKLELQRHHDGSSVAHVLASGGTRVMCSVQGRLVPPPNPDRPQNGAVVLSVDLSPSASPSFFNAAPVTSGGGGSRPSEGPPMEDNQLSLSNRILSTAETLVGQALDVEALCVTPQAWVWQLDCSLVVLDASGGNCLDSCILGLLAAMRHYRQPHVEHAEGHGLPKLVPTELKEPTPLPLHHTPLTVSFGIMESNSKEKGRGNDNNDVVLLVDPTDKEEQVCEGTVTVACDVHGQICLFDYWGGSIPVDSSLLRDTIELAIDHVRSLAKVLEERLTEAGEQARAKGLKELQQRKWANNTTDDDDDENIPEVPFYVKATPDEVMDEDADDNDATAMATTEADELYRQQALEYNRGHQTQKVRENSDRDKVRPSSNSLLARMLASVSKSSPDPGPDSADMQQATSTENPTAPKKDHSPPKGTEKVASETVVDSIVEQKSPPLSDKKREPVVPITDGKLDSDEEEDVTMLSSEFQEPDAAKPKEASPAIVDEPDDLAAAIKKKKKKKKYKK